MADPSSFPNDEQRAVLDSLEGPLLVLAPAGTGKTRVMADRLARALEAGLVVPADALCLTFTNRAAHEVRDRVAERLGPQARGLAVRTFHGLCAYILRREAGALGWSRDFVVYDEQDAAEVAGALLGKLPRSQQDRLGTGGKVVERIQRAKAAVRDPRCDRGWIDDAFAGDPDLARLARRYQDALADQHAVDFGDLVLGARAALAELPERRAFWEGRFGWIQVDEVQDTHHSEYDLLRHLGRRSGHLALFGDLDQTIYEWRGSDPEAVLAAFRRDFGPVRELGLGSNYRATRSLLEVADRFAASFPRRRTRIVPAATLPHGNPVELYEAETAQEEARWIAAQLRCETGSVAVLARTHVRTQEVSAALSAAGVSHVTVEDYQFFRRQEVKDGLARVRLILNPADAGALRRCLLRPPSGAGAATLRRFDRDAPGAALRLPDLLRPAARAGQDPFDPFLRAFDDGRLVVLDVETTGLDPTTDEVIELAAVRIRGGRVEAELYHLLRPTRPVGGSQAVHGISDDELAAKGEDPGSVLDAFAAFARDAHLLGHNLRFDLAMLDAQAARCGRSLPDLPFDDSLDLARRLLPGQRHDLASVCTRLGVEVRPTHRALDDVRATAAVVAALVPRLRETAAARREIVAAAAAPFARLGDQVQAWRSRIGRDPPSTLLESVLEDSGLRAHYRKEERRLAHLDDLVAIARRSDEAGAPSRARLEHFLQQASLTASAFLLEPGDGRIPVLTVHQAKGLEFDTVYLAGLRDGEFPSWWAVRDGKLDEERRLFYVALTRARRRLVLSGHRSSNGWSDGLSRFVTGGLAGLTVVAT